MTARQHERCDIQIEPGRTIKIVPKKNEEHLNEQQLVDYEEHRWEFIQWLRFEGKDPEKHESYSDYLTYGTAYRTARFVQWVWSKEGRYSIPPTSKHADAFMDEVTYRDVSTATNGKIEEALIRSYRYIEQSPHGQGLDRNQQFRSGGFPAGWKIRH